MTLLFWLLFIVLALAVLSSALTYLFYLYEAFNTQAEAPEEWTWPGARAIGKAFLLDAVAQCAVTLTYGLVLFQSRIYSAKRLRETGGPPILLLHGLYHNSTGWLLFQHRLRRAGFRRVQAYSYTSWGANVFEQRVRLSREVERIFTETGEPVVLIGHSLGGLQVRSYLNQPVSQGKVRAAVTLGAPHRGSRLAALGLGRLARNLIHRSEAIRQIEAEDREPPCPALSLSNLTDNYVLPQSALRLDAPGWRGEITPATSHIHMLYHRPTFERVLAFLRELE